jgi:hypothetical protein
MQMCYADKSLNISPNAHFTSPEGDMPIETDCSKYDEQGTKSTDFIFGTDNN